MSNKFVCVAIAAVAVAYYASSDGQSRSLTREEVIAQCKELANSKSSSTVVPMVVGAVDSSGFPASHPCKFSYFEGECRSEIQKQTFNHCITSMKGR